MTQLVKFEAVNKIIEFQEKIGSVQRKTVFYGVSNLTLILLKGGLDVGLVFSIT